MPTLSPTRRVVGCMTGTSIDGIDAALIEITGTGLAMRAEFLSGASLPLGDVATTLRKLADQKPVTAGDIARAMLELSAVHINAISAALCGERLDPARDLICVHGQTVFHAPPASWQLMQPAPISAAFGVPVVFDLRAADLARGGQGAPITPIADWILFRDHADCVVNLGGFCNFTAWDARAASEHGVKSIRGGDICSCNQLLDGLARRLLKQPYDADGAVAATGTINEDAMEELLPSLLAQTGGRSLGTGDEFDDFWLRGTKAPPADLLCTACCAIAATLLDRLNADRILLAGGGVRNRTLIEEIRGRLTSPTTTVNFTDDFGIPAQFREAVCFAVLGALCADRVPITLPSVTGVRAAPISGAWVYG
jgi:anhydro-N-acetylmuramic acid kinase